MRNYSGKLCDDCHSRPATCLTTIEINGARYEVALCDDCYKRRAAANSPVYRTFMNPEPECPVCHTRLSDVADGRYLGCSECYNVFRSQVLNNIYEMHGTRKHVGKKPRADRRNKNVGLSDDENLREQYHLARDEGRLDDAEEILDFLRGENDDQR